MPIPFPMQAGRTFRREAEHFKRQFDPTPNGDSRWSYATRVVASSAMIPRREAKCR